MARARETQPLTVTHVAGGYKDWGLAHLVLDGEWCAPTKLVAGGFKDIVTPSQYVARAGRIGTKGTIHQVDMKRLQRRTPYPYKKCVHHCTPRPRFYSEIGDKNDLRHVK